MKRVICTSLAFLALVFASAIETEAQTITSQFRRIRADAMARDAIFNEDDVIVRKRKASRNAGSFSEDRESIASTITGDTESYASQDSSVDTGAAFIYAESNLNTRSIEDGASNSLAECFTRVQFDLDGSGIVRFESAYVELGRAFINNDPRDDEYERSDDAFFYIRIFDTNSGSRVYNKTVRLSRDETYNEFDDNFDIALPAGSYRLDVRARITGDDGFNTVQGQPRGSYVYSEVEIQLIEN